MAKTLTHKYTFTPSLDKVVVEGIIHKERFLLITNVEDNVVLYNFGDINLGGDVTFDFDKDETTIILEKDCSQMSSTDELQIFYEQDHVEIEPSETFVDPVSKFRVSNPENLIDTDFEYGPQASKWETLQLVNNIPSFYSSSSDTTIPFIDTITSTAGSDIITVTTEFEHGLSKGIPITVTGLSSLTAEGTYLVGSVPTTTSFTYVCRSAQQTSRQLQGTYTSIIPGKFFQGSQVEVDEAIGIVADYYELVVKTVSVTPITVTSTPGSGFVANAFITSASGGTAQITNVSGSIITVRNVTGIFADGDDLSVTGSSDVATIATSGVGTSVNRFFIDDVQQPTLDLSRKAIYRFDLSDASNTGHELKISLTSDGTHNSGSEFTTYTYYNGTAGSAGSYYRIYVTNTTPSPLYYYCANHSGMGGQLDAVQTDTSRVFLTTASPHGFSDNTNFYFVNTVSPKVLEVNDPSATAPDGRPFVDTAQTFTNNISVDNTESIPYNYESTYTKRFGSGDVDYANNTITITGHGLQSGYALLYYPAPGDTPIGGLSRMCVYYAERVDADTIKLHDSQRTNALKTLTNTGTFNSGSHTLGLVYNCYREYKAWNNNTGYKYHYYQTFGGTYSGHDFTVDGTYGLGGQPWDIVAFMSINRPGYSHNNGSYHFFQHFGHNNSNKYWRTYGYHLQALPLGTTAQFQGVYDFVTDHENWGVNGNNDQGNNPNQSQYGYTVGGYGGVNPKNYYYSSSYTAPSQNTSALTLQGTNFYYWGRNGQGYWNRSTLNKYYNTITSDGRTNMYWILLKRNTSTNDSLYAQSHGALTDQAYTISISSGNINYWTDVTGGSANLPTSSTVYIDKIDNDRFRIKSGTQASPYRLHAITGTISLSAVVTNPTKNSIYIANSGFALNELVTYTYVTPPAFEIGGLTNGTSYYAKPLSNNRFQLGTTLNFANEVGFSSTGIGTQTFENTTANFGVVDGSYSTTKVVDEDTLEVVLPFKLSPGTKSFNATSDVTTGASGYITINDNYFSTGTKVIYDTQGGTALGGLSDNTDYYVVIVDDSRFRLATSLANAQAGTTVTITGTQTGTHRFISSNLSGLVGGSGSVAIENGTRVVTGTDTLFNRFFKIGDTIRIVNSATTPGTIIERNITAIKSDTELLVDTAYTVTRSGENYLIPSFIYVRPDGFFLHRPFDGGMEIATSKSPNGLICRQTRKYFRYQSGKGIQTSFAINFIPPIPITSLTNQTVGTATTTTISGNVGVNTISVGSTSGLVVDMPLTGTGCADKVRIASIAQDGSNIITLTLDNTSAVSGVGNFDAVNYAVLQTEKPHNIEDDLEIEVHGSDVADYNGKFDVAYVDSEYQLRYFLQQQAGNAASGGFMYFNVTGWNDSSVRAGMFDFQNGFFFEFDGQDIYCVRRSSVQQLVGRVTATKGSGTITGTGTLFGSQLTNGDKIVIRGMTHKVVKVISDTTLAVQPGYKGISASDIIVTKTIDTRVKQSDWNIDVCDGTGKSGFKLDLTKIQMCYADYSWYGAGKIRFGFKDQKGHVKYVHEFKHNNKLIESYFRSGNLPARYEIENFDNPNYIPTLFHWGTSVIMDGTYQDDEAYLFTASGNVQKFTNTIVQSYTTQANTSIVRVGSGWSNVFTYYIVIPFQGTDKGALTDNSLLYNTTVANNFFKDGRAITPLSRDNGSNYDVWIQYVEGTRTTFPRNYESAINAALGNPVAASGTVFTIGGLAGDTDEIPQNIPLITIRLAPSVDSSISGSLGQREIINRMQLQLDSVGVQATHETEISMILNAQLSTDTFEDAAAPSLSQLVRHSSTDTISGGQQILSFRASGGAVEGSRRLTATTNFDLSEISSLGNSILGGDGVFPNGPDLLTIVANITDATGVSGTNPYNVTARVTWKESQA